MDNQEAIKGLKNIIEYWTYKPTEVEVAKLAIEAIEKQIPKEVSTETINRGIDVSGEYDIESNMLCPNCKAVVGDYEANELYFDYCPTCGQRLKVPQEQNDA